MITKKSIAFIVYFVAGLSFLQSQVIDSTKHRVDSLIQKATNYHVAYEIQKSIETANKAIKLADKSDDHYNRAHSYNLIGLNYDLIKDFKEAERSYNKGIYHANKVENDTLLCWLHNNIAEVYEEGYGNMAKSIESYRQALKYAKKINDTIEILTPILNIGWTYIDHEEYEKALPYLTESAGYIEQSGDTQSKAQLNFLLGRYNVNANKLDAASQNFADAVVFGEASKIYDELSDIYLEYAKLADFKGDIQHANELLLKHITSKEKVLDEQKIAQASLAQAKFIVDEYKRELQVATDKEIAQEKMNQRRNMILTIIGITMLLLLILLFISFRMMSVKNRLSKMLKKRNDELFLAKKEAEDLAKVKSEFISTVSHELRTPLYGVVGLTSLLLDDASFSKKEHSILKSLKFSGDYLLNLINDVLQLSKIESKKVVLNDTSFNVKALLKNIQHSFEYQAEQRNNKVKIKIEKNVPKQLIGDSVRLSQILINLVGNAIKFTENDTVLIALHSNGINNRKANLTFEIIDHGIGIPKERQKEIFDSFTQVDRAQGNIIGTGLGLTVVKQLVNLFGGDIELKSEANKGATFSFTIDLEVDEKTKAVSSDDLGFYKGGKKRNVLIVEDNKINQMVTQRILENANFNCEIAENGLDGVDLMKDASKNFDLILMDMNMPKMNGIDASRAIREFDSETPIVFLTATELEEIKDDIFNAGINDYIIKPYDKYEFYQVIMRNINNN
ncbi:ATP-binding protein [Spongiivirga citrea]|uniref:histidine kinase n=1 Tax=Spongiivirga citrea TaxID=1481457 RepID=A0A6M0CLG3_9FLAO|nr:ATP-binding protein [Spongiivirga citrea]NER16689.1 response regulator [Spongiivirga citrea]